MSFYRNLLVAVAAMSLGTAVFADDATTSTTTTESTATQPADTTTTTAVQPADNTQAATTSTTTTTTTTSDKLDINTASAKQLMKIKGINGARAKQIVKYRKEHGNFKSVDDLKELKGFKRLSDKKFQNLEDQLTAS